MKMYKYQYYKELESKKELIVQEAKEAGFEIGILPGLENQLGLYPSNSGYPRPLPRRIRAAVTKVQSQTVLMTGLVNRIRELVKDIYGDEYDAVPVNTAEAGLLISFDTLVAPPFVGRGIAYRARYIVPLERSIEYFGAYGRPFPPFYKDIISDRGCSVGSFGVQGKALENLDVVYMRLPGARYENHGIKYYTTCLLGNVDPEEARNHLLQIAERHCHYLAGFASLGYDVPTNGYGKKDNEGTPLLQKYLGETAKLYDVPYIVDNAMGLPGIGTDIRKTGADIMVYSMDKAANAPTSGLIIGLEERIVPIRRSLGMHTEKSGTTGSYGKAAYVTADPGRDAIAGQIATLEWIQEEPDMFIKPVDTLFTIVKEEIMSLPTFLQKGITITPSYNSQGVFLDYTATWKNEEFGIPIFTVEDLSAGSDLFLQATRAMGLMPTLTHGGSIFVGHGFGTVDDEGNLIEERMRLAVKALVKIIEIICRHAGLIKSQ
jgi:hypothetical protein